MLSSNTFTNSYLVVVVTDDLGFDRAEEEEDGDVNGGDEEGDDHDCVLVGQTKKMVAIRITRFL